MNIALIGVGGFGGSVLNALKSLQAAGELRISAAADVEHERNRDKIRELEAAGTKVYRDYSEMLARECELDAVAIATPIHLHKEMAIHSMEAGRHVLMEKPPATSIQDVDAIIDAAERTGRLCAVDFQRSSCGAFLELKRRIADGFLGNIRSITGVGLWRRLDEYYARTGWAGRLAVNGNWVLDGTVCNPLAHLINNMLLLGRLAPNAGGAAILTVTAELYHAHDIEGEDTSCLRAEMGNGVCLYFYATLCHESNDTPYITVEGDRGKAYWDFDHRLGFDMADGETIRAEYAPDLPGAGGANPLIVNMLRNLLDVARGRAGRLFCSVQDTRSYVEVLNGAFLSSGGTHAIPTRYLNRYPAEGSVATDLTGIRELILLAAGQRKLFSELGVEWAVAGRETDVRGLSRFTMNTL